MWGGWVKGFVIMIRLHTIMKTLRKEFSWRIRDKFPTRDHGGELPEDWPEVVVGP